MPENSSTHYNPAQIEQAIYQKWEEDSAFSHQRQKSDDATNTYCIMIPPPNVTGSLHMGHAFQDTIMDILIRYNRMKGKQTLWQSGTDHAGIATQMVVERQLAAQGKTRHELGRDAFIDEVWKWKAESGNTIQNQLKRMGASIDWEQERFTMDEGLSKAVQKVFVQLYQEGLIYRGKRLVNWDPVLETAVSDLEVESHEENGHLWHIRYALTDNPSHHLVVATTRPETLLGDVAVAVHPEDERYKDLIGQSVSLPLTNRTLPIVADDYVDPEFGTGCLKITPAHDFNDYEVGKRHNLPLISVLSSTAKITLKGSKYDDLDRYVARKLIIKDLEEQNLIEKIDDHHLVVPRGDRSGAVIEPRLTDQWYVAVKDLAKEATEVVENSQIKFIPDNWKNTYYEWMNNIEDWCISRQIWWGHRIPAWYDSQGNIFVAESEQEARKLAGGDVELHQDEDVLDTWFSSALWPFSTLGWPDETEKLATYYPTSVLVTGFDIIFFWVARMIMFGTKFTGTIPFKEVYIHGLVRDSEGQKMSKAKGNGVDPIDVIEGIDLDTLIKKRTTGMMQPKMAAKIEKSTRKQFPEGIKAYGTDALRFTFASQATQGRDIRFDLARVEGNRNFCNKLWNVARYVSLSLGDNVSLGGSEQNLRTSTADKWILSRLQQTITDIEKHIKNYRFDQYAQSLYDFVWNEYCAWYVELNKVILADDLVGDDEKQQAKQTLITVLDAILRMAHPIMPYITEKIWQQFSDANSQYTEDVTTIMHSAFPQSDVKAIDQEAVAEIEWLKSVVTVIRNIRSEMNIAPGKALEAKLEDAQASDQEYLKRNEKILTKIGKLSSIALLPAGTTAPESASGVAGAMKVLIPLGSFLDREAEIERLSKERVKIRANIQSIESRLNNKAFVSNAPEEVVAKTQQQLAEAQSTEKLLSEQVNKLSA